MPAVAAEANEPPEQARAKQPMEQNRSGMFDFMADC